MKHITLIGARENRPGTFTFYFRTKAGWKEKMTVSNIFGARDMAMIAPSMTEEEFIALPNQEDLDFIKRIQDGNDAVLTRRLNKELDNDILKDFMTNRPDL